MVEKLLLGRKSFWLVVGWAGLDFFSLFFLFSLPSLYRGLSFLGVDSVAVKMHSLMGGENRVRWKSRFGPGRADFFSLSPVSSPCQESPSPSPVDSTAWLDGSKKFTLGESRFGWLSDLSSLSLSSLSLLCQGSPSSSSHGDFSSLS